MKLYLICCGANVTVFNADTSISIENCHICTTTYEVQFHVYINLHKSQYSVRGIYIYAHSDA